MNSISSKSRMIKLTTLHWQRIGRLFCNQQQRDFGWLTLFVSNDLYHYYHRVNNYPSLTIIKRQQLKSQLQQRWSSYMTTTPLRMSTSLNMNTVDTVASSSTSSTNIATNSTTSNVSNRKRYKDIWFNSVYDNHHTNTKDLDTNGENNQPHQLQQQEPKEEEQQQYWTNWFLPQEYENPWDVMIHTNENVFSRLNTNINTNTSNNNSNSNNVLAIQKQYDYSTKHCISLLLYHHHYTITQNTITTELCNVILHKLLDTLPNNTSSSSSSTNTSNNSNNSTKDNKNKNTNSNISNEEKSIQIAHRAYTILQNMEYMDHHRIPSIYEYIKYGKNNVNYMRQLIETTILHQQQQQRHQQESNNTSLSSLSSTQSMNNNEPNELQQLQQQSLSTNRRLPRLIPKPNRDTYNTILLLLSRTMGTGYYIPMITYSIVKQMEYRYDYLHELDMKVTNYHYNCILLSYSYCIEYDKCIYATQLLIYNAIICNDNHMIVDASSYIHVLRICANHMKVSSSSTNTNTTIDPDQLQYMAQQLGANVAIKLWQFMFERDTIISTTAKTKTGPLSSLLSSDSSSNSNNSNSSTLLSALDDTTLTLLLQQYLTKDEMDKPLYVPKDLPPHFYSHFLQAIRPLPISSSSTGGGRQQQQQNKYNNNSKVSVHQQRQQQGISNNIRDMYFMKCMDHAIENGKVNQYVLQEFFIHVKNMYIFDLYLGQYRTQIYGMNANDAVQHLLTIIPKHWTNKIDTSTYANATNNVNSSNKE